MSAVARSDQGEHRSPAAAAEIEKNVVKGTINLVVVVMYLVAIVYMVVWHVSLS